MWHVTNFIYIQVFTQEDAFDIVSQSPWGRALFEYEVATISRLLKIIGLFCKRALHKRPIFFEETYNFKEPTNHSHPLRLVTRERMCNVTLQQMRHITHEKLSDLFIYTHWHPHRETQSLMWANLLDAVRYLIVWNPVIVGVIYFFWRGAATCIFFPCID